MTAALAAMELELLVADGTSQPERD